MRKPLYSLMLDKFAEQVRNLWGELQADIMRSTASALAGREQAIEVDATAAPVTITLPLANQHTGRFYFIWKTDASANAVTIARSGADTINGATTLVLADRYEGACVFSNGRSLWEALLHSGGAVPPIGGCTLLGSMIFTDFSDTQYFIPVYANKSNALASQSLTFVGPGSALLQMAGDPGETGHKQIGIKTRFKIMADENGEIEWRTKFEHVTFPDTNDEVGANLDALFTVWLLHYGYTVLKGPGLGQRNGTTDFVAGFLDISEVEGLITAGGGGTINTQPAPAPDIIIQLRGRFSGDGPSGGNVVPNMSYEINGDGFPDITGGFGHQSAHMFGFPLFIGIGRGKMTGGFNATITELEIVKGRIIPEC